MSIEITRYTRKPFFVDAIQVTAQNLNAVAAWCEGALTPSPATSTRPSVDYIVVPVHLARTDRQTKAFVGDWVLKSLKGFKVYTNKAFEQNFDITDEPTQIVFVDNKPETPSVGDAMNAVFEAPRAVNVVTETEIVPGVSATRVEKAQIVITHTDPVRKFAHANAYHRAMENGSTL